MKICRFFPIRFPSLNEWIAAAKSGRGKYNAYSRMKDTFDRVGKTGQIAVAVPANVLHATLSQR
jgi:hypothetical protein